MFWTSAGRAYTTGINGQKIAVIGATQVFGTAQTMSSWAATDSQPGLASAFDEDRLLQGVRAGCGRARRAGR